MTVMILIILFWLATFISIKGLGWVSKVTEISEIARIVLEIGFILLAFGLIFLI